MCINCKLNEIKELYIDNKISNEQTSTLLEKLGQDVVSESNYYAAIWPPGEYIAFVKHKQDKKKKDIQELIRCLKLMGMPVTQSKYHH
jgi:hypothetical protein